MDDAVVLVQCEGCPTLLDAEHAVIDIGGCYLCDECAAEAPKVCPTCEGDCYVDADPSDRDAVLAPDATAFGQPLTTCPTCGGSGEQEHFDSPCGECRGEGVVTEPGLSGFFPCPTCSSPSGRGEAKP